MERIVWMTSTNPIDEVLGLCSAYYHEVVLKTTHNFPAQRNI